MNCLVEQVLLAGDQEDDEGHVDVMVAGLLGTHGAGVQRVEDGDHELVNITSRQHVTSELGVSVEQQIQQECGLLGVQGGGQGAEQAGVLHPKLGLRVQGLLRRVGERE